MKHIIYTLLLLVAATACFAQNTDSLPPYADDEIIDNNKVTPGKKMKEGKVEFYDRATRQFEDVSLDEVVKLAKDRIDAAKQLLNAQ